MTPFNLQKAVAGEPICDQFGRKVKFIAHVPEAVEHNRVVYLSFHGYVHEVGENGKVLSAGQYWNPALYMFEDA